MSNRKVKLKRLIERIINEMEVEDFPDPPPLDIDENKTELVGMINNNGEIVDKSGYAIEGEGIFDKEGEEYPAGFTQEGEIYAGIVGSGDDHPIMTTDGSQEIGWELNDKIDVNQLKQENHIKDIVREIINEQDQDSEDYDLKNENDFVNTNIDRIIEILSHTPEEFKDTIEALKKTKEVYDQELRKNMS